MISVRAARHNVRNFRNFISVAVLFGQYHEVKSSHNKAITHVKYCAVRELQVTEYAGLFPMLVGYWIKLLRCAQTDSVVVDR